MYCRRSCVVALGLALCLSAVAVAADWTQFRGSKRDNVSAEVGLPRAWQDGGPKVLWTVDACQGYAGPAVYGERVYFQDYDEEAREWSVRCLALDSGEEQWRYTERRRIRPNHGITRAVPAVDEKYVFALDPKCTFHCLDRLTGKEVWRKSLVKDYGAQIPPWYNGQCPLIEADRVVIGVGGEALLVALDKATGAEIWRTPNVKKRPLSHSSVMPATLGGVKQYLWCTLFGPLGVRASDGKLLWEHERKFNIAVAPSPLAIDDERVFMTSGYDAGSVMLRVKRDGEAFGAEVVFDLTSDDAACWNSEVHTPILHDGHMFLVGKKKRGLFSCYDLDGKLVWNSGGQASFGLGSFLLADGMFFVLEGKTGKLRLLDANTTEYRELATAQVLSGHDVWGPMALAGGKLLLRDMTKLVCVEVGGSGAAPGPSAGMMRQDASYVGMPMREAVGMAPKPTGWKPVPHGMAPGEMGRQSPTLPLRSRVGHPASVGGAGLVCAMPVAGGLGVVLALLDGGELPRRYYKRDVIGGKGHGEGEFQQTLRGLAVDGDDNLYAVGDRKVVVYSPAGKFLRSWRTEKAGYSIAVDKQGDVYVGQGGLLEIFDASGKVKETWRDVDRLGLVTGIAISANDMFIADVQARCVRRYDRRGKFVADIGKDNRMRGFLLPNRHLDIDVDARGALLVANPGRHRVERYTPDGKRLGYFGRFAGRDPAGFSGCCNPTNIALMPSGDVVAVDKAPPRVKVYDIDGKLLALMGADDLDPNCKNTDVAVNSRGWIYVADTVKLGILVYARAAEATTRPATQEATP